MQGWSVASRGQMMGHLDNSFDLTIRVINQGNRVEQTRVDMQ